MLNFIRLQLKLKWGINKNNSKVNAILTTLAALLAIAIALALVFGLSFVLKASIGVNAPRLATLYLTIIMIGLTIVAINMQINRLYHPKDINITARFPLSSFKIFLSNVILNYIDLLIYSAVLLLPILLVFGWAMNYLTITYFFGIILGILFTPLIPFGLSIFIAIPIMFINSLLKKQNVIKLILFILFLAGCFYLYYVILQNLATFFIHRNWEEGTLEIWKSIIDNLNVAYNPANYISNIIFYKDFWIAVLIILGVSLVLIIGGIVLARLIYNYIRRKELDGGSVASKRYTKINAHNSSRAILWHTFKEILRTKSYFYFYLGVAISSPVMVFFSERLVSLVGKAQLGSDINFGISILVVSVFMAMIGSFSATILSIEGKNFYITKLVPVSYRRQLLLKGLLNVLVSIGALLVSAIVFIALEFINPLELTILLISQIILVIGIVFNGINLNLANPNLKPKANGEAEEINVTYMLLIGLVIAAIEGGLSIILPRLETIDNTLIYLSLIGISLVYALINALIFWFTVNKRYQKIEI